MGGSAVRMRGKVLQRRARLWEKHWERKRQAERR